MQRLISLLVLTLALSGVTADWLRERGHTSAGRPCETASSRGASGWQDPIRQTQTSVLEPSPGLTGGVDRSTAIPREMAAPNHGRHLASLPARVARPHDPPHLHSFALLI